MQSKKALEQPRVIIYILFTTILVISGLYIAYTYLGATQVRLTLSDHALNYNTVSARIINTPECLGATKSYEYDRTTYYYSEAGIIDYEKFKPDKPDSANQRLTNCVLEEVYLELIPIPDVDNLDSFDVMETWSEWKGATTDGAPNKKPPQTIIDPWKQRLEREIGGRLLKYYVLVLKDDELHPASLKIIMR